MDERQHLSLLLVSADHCRRAGRSSSEDGLMRSFGYARAAEPDEALSLAGHEDTAFVAGGTELLNWMRLGIREPARVLDIGRLSALRGVRREGDVLTIGALATLNEIEADPLVRRDAPVLAEACLRAASAQIRNRATLGGNLLQKTRCAYFRAEPPLPWPCNKRNPGSGCAALDGHHERLAIFGWTEACVATQPSDPAVALACLDAQLQIASPRGTRLLDAADFHLTPEIVRSEARRSTSTTWDEASLETRLTPGELITAVRVPVSALSHRSAYLKVRERESYEYAMVSAAAALDLDGTCIRAARIALGSVAQKPWRLDKAERALVGQLATRESLAAAVQDAMREARPLAHNAFKLRLAANAAVRALELAAHRAERGAE
jgi:xanthine dehydrogenase YagS FAD-binding subunit